MQTFTNITDINHIPMFDKDIVVVYKDKIQQAKIAYDDTLRIFEPRGIITFKNFIHVSFHIHMNTGHELVIVPDKEEFLIGRKPFIKIPIVYYRMLLDEELNRLSDPQ